MRMILLGLLICIVATGAGANELLIIPQPREIQLEQEFLSITGEVVIRQLFAQDERPLVLASEELSQLLTLPQPDGSRTRISLASLESGGRQAQNLAQRFNLACPERAEGYALKVTPQEIVIVGSDNRGLFYGIKTLIQLIQPKGNGFQAQCGVIVDYPSLEFRGIHFFTGKEALAEQKRLVDIMADHKMNHIVLQVDYLEFKSYPEIRYAPYAQTQEEVRALIAYARDRYIQVTPLVNSLGHAEWAFRASHSLLDIAEDPETPAAFTATNPRTYKFLYQIYDEIIDLFEPEIFHLGLDEIDHAGRFPHRPETQKYSMTEILDIFLNRLEPYFHQKGISQLMIWGDMFLHASESPDAAFAEDLREAKGRRAILYNAMRKDPPMEYLITDWHYRPARPEQYTSLDIFHQLGLRTIASPWYNPENIRNFALKAIEENSLGLLQTTWAGFNFHIVENKDCYEQFEAYLLAADYAWSGREEQIDELPYDFHYEFWKRWYAPSLLGGGSVLLQDILPVLSMRPQRELHMEIAPVISDQDVDKLEMVDYELTCVLSNPFDDPLNIRISSKAPAFEKTVHVPVKSRENRVTFPFSYPKERVNLNSYLDVDYEVFMEDTPLFEITRRAHIAPVWYARQLPAPLKVDADLSKWKGVKPYVYDTWDFVARKSQWTPEDLSAKFYLGYYGHQLYMAFEVTDDVHHNPFAGRYIWEGDCIQMGFDFYHDRTPFYNLNDMEIGFALDNDGNHHVQTWLDPFEGEKNIMEVTEFAARREGNKTYYEIMIPLDTFGDSRILDRRYYGFTFTINDNDGDGFAGGINGSHGLWGSKNPSQFGTLVLK